MPKTQGETLNTRLRFFYKNDAIAKKFFTWAALRQNNSQYTSVDRIMFICSINRSQAIKFMKTLQDFDLGVFKKGRGGRKTRIEWKLRLISIGKRAVSASRIYPPSNSGYLEKSDYNGTELIDHGTEVNLYCSVISKTWMIKT